MASNVGGEIGSPAPDFSLPWLDGGDVSLADFQDRRLLVFMWGSW
jgi:peroxiredoxin